MNKVRKGMVRDAETARTAAEVNEALRAIDSIIQDHAEKAWEGDYGGAPGRKLYWDLTAARARLAVVRELVNGTGCEFCRVPKL